VVIRVLNRCGYTFYTIHFFHDVIVLRLSKVCSENVMTRPRKPRQLPSSNIEMALCNADGNDEAPPQVVHYPSLCLFRMPVIRALSSQISLPCTALVRHFQVGGPCPSPVIEGVLIPSYGHRCPSLPKPAFPYSTSYPRKMPDTQSHCTACILSSSSSPGIPKHKPAPILPPSSIPARLFSSSKWIYPSQL